MNKQLGKEESKINYSIKDLKIYKVQNCLIANKATELRSEVDSAADYSAAQCGQKLSNSA